MSDVTSLRETGTISLREALRCVVHGHGEVGQRTAKRWVSVSFRELTHDDHKTLDTGAQILFGWLQAGKLDALHRSDSHYISCKIPQLDWLCCKFEEVYWHLSAIRTQQHTPMIENIEVINTNFNRLISKITPDYEENDQNSFSVPTIYSRSRKKHAALQIIEELEKEGIRIKETSNVTAIKLIQDRAEAKRKAGDITVDVFGDDTIRRALDRKT